MIRSTLSRKTSGDLHTAPNKNKYSESNQIPMSAQFIADRSRKIYSWYPLVLDTTMLTASIHSLVVDWLLFQRAPAWSGIFL